MGRKKLVSLHTYPAWVCDDCAKAAGGEHPEVWCSTYHPDECGVCKEQKMVTEPRDWQYPNFDLLQEKYKMRPSSMVIVNGHKYRLVNEEQELVEEILQRLQEYNVAVEDDAFVFILCNGTEIKVRGLNPANEFSGLALTLTYDHNGQTYFTPEELIEFSELTRLLSGIKESIYLG